MSVAQPARRIGRILSIGVPLPGPRVDNYNFFSAPSFFDYDALIVDMFAMARLVENVIDGTLEPETFAHQRVCNDATATDAVALADMLARRRDETERLLANGGAVVVFAQPPHGFIGIDGMPGASNYGWLPEPGGVRYDEHILPADGTQAQVVDFQHPLAPVVLAQLANIAYRCRIDVDAIPSFTPRGRIFVRSHGGAAVGVELPADAGRIVLLPALKAVPSGDGRYALSEAMQACVRRLLGVMAEGREPTWLTKHTLPGLDERTAAVKDAQSRRDDAQRALDEAAATRDEIARYQSLLWQEGALGLEPTVVAALRLLGFDVYDANPDEIEIKLGAQSALVEVDASDGAVGMAAHYRLRQRIERAIERRGVAPRGLLLINGHRLKAPHERGEQASEALRLAAETMRYCIAPTTALFDAVRACMSGDTTPVENFRNSILTTDGLLEEGQTSS